MPQPDNFGSFITECSPISTTSITSNVLIPCVQNQHTYWTLAEGLLPSNVNIQVVDNILQITYNDGDTWIDIYNFDEIIGSSIWVDSGTPGFNTGFFGPNGQSASVPTSRLYLISVYIVCTVADPDATEKSLITFWDDGIQGQQNTIIPSWTPNAVGAYATGTCSAYMAAGNVMSLQLLGGDSWGTSSYDCWWSVMQNGL